MSVQTSYSSAMTAAFAGKADRIDSCITMRNDQSASIPFGRAVNFASATDPMSAELPDDAADIIAGIVIHSHAYAKDEQLDATGVVDGELLNVLRKGRVWVTCPSGCSVGDRLWVRQDVTGGGSEVEGGLEDAEDTDNIDCTNAGVWLTSASAGELALLEVDFTNAPA